MRKVLADVFKVANIRSQIHAQGWRVLSGNVVKYVCNQIHHAAPAEHIFHLRAVWYNIYECTRQIILYVGQSQLVVSR